MMYAGTVSITVLSRTSRITQRACALKELASLTVDSGKSDEKDQREKDKGLATDALRHREKQVKRRSKGKRGEVG